jgi:hypothetical protein
MFLKILLCWLYCWLSSKQLVAQWTKSVESNGGYVKKLCSCQAQRKFMCLRLCHKIKLETKGQHLKMVQWGSSIPGLEAGNMNWLINFHSRTGQHLDIINFFIHQLMRKWVGLKTILKFTLKQLRHVSVQSHHHQGAHYSCLLKLQLLKQSIKIHRCW